MIIDSYNLARKFIYRNARPLDLALFKYHFENGSADEVLTTLAAYQNDDGGFAHAIEPDLWNVNSTPIAIWAAISKLKQIGFPDKSHPIMRGILKYLDSGKDFFDGKWCNTVPSNNDYPHAVWWECRNSEGVPDNNPTASLAGFALKFADKGSALYSKASKIAKSAVAELVSGFVSEMHTIRCFMELYEYCLEAEIDFLDMAAFKAALCDAISKVVCSEPEKWITEYVCTPSFFYNGSTLIFEIIKPDLFKKEAELIVRSQQQDGTFPVTWEWYNGYKEFELSKNWWKSEIIINNFLFFRALEG